MNSSAANDARSYLGPERRHHRMLVTRNSEYHCRDGRCVAVRDRHTGEFIRGHHAIGKKLSAGIRFTDDGGIAQVSPPEELLEGEQVCFSSRIDDQEYDVVTSPLLRIDRPPKDVVALYDAA
jgi:hypothetical protein